MSPQNGRVAFGVVNSFLSDLGMELAVDKCLTFEIVPTRNAWYSRNPNIKNGEACLKSVEINQAFKY